MGGNPSLYTRNRILIRHIVLVNEQLIRHIVIEYDIMNLSAALPAPGYGPGGAWRPPFF
ncbi:hypothetical protein AZ18_1172 [Bordetella bronchiseptica D993]|nr:hypothetical protein AZ18_1172 [Bordetella bronchiseptica D993]KDC01636.1 hypothetical protein AZ23_1186 [Bordetella bronchiseptica E010]KDD30239.1 hypothetical protein L527_1139 [Bordetella bronchiseptica MBORD839]